MKAFEANYGQEVVLAEDAIVPPHAPSVNKGEVVKMLRLDGKYCNAVNKDGEKVYITAYTEVCPK